MKDRDGMALPTMVMVVGLSVFVAALIVGCIGLYVMFGRPPAGSSAANAVVASGPPAPSAPASAPAATNAATVPPGAAGPTNTAVPPVEQDASLPEAERATPQPPRRRKVVEASIEFNRVRELHGMAGATAYSESCYTALRRRPNWGNLDFCMAFDQIASRNDASAASTMNWPRTDYFTDNLVAGRQITAARRMFPNSSDAISRVTAVRAMADSLP